MLSLLAEWNGFTEFSPDKPDIPAGLYSGRLAKIANKAVGWMHYAKEGKDVESLEDVARDIVYQAKHYCAFYKRHDVDAMELLSNLKGSMSINPENLPINFRHFGA